jgi:hypothetical protein
MMFKKFLALGTSLLLFFVSVSGVFAGPPLPGAIFTTDSACSGVNVNIYGSKEYVYLDGGPSKPGAASLPDGSYYVQVTDPSGATVLGTSVGTTGETPFVVTDGNTDCINLWDVLIQPDVSEGYLDTTNEGGVYKVWVSNEPSFTNNSTKTDNFRVAGNQDNIETASLSVIKFYDANVNGIFDEGEEELEGWKINIMGVSLDFDEDGWTPANFVLAIGNYTISEYPSITGNWVPTTVVAVELDLEAGDNETIEFGNVCLGAGGGLTRGFWSNKNGQALVTAEDITTLTTLNLKNPNGDNFDPGNYAEFKTWISKANATNMAYMLSAQLAAMALNVENDKVDGEHMIYAPELLQFGPTPAGLNDLGFISIDDLVEAGDSELGSDGHNLTKTGSSFRAYQEALKNALDNANNNTNFVQPEPCGFSFDQEE